MFPPTRLSQSHETFVSLRPRPILGKGEFTCIKFGAQIYGRE